MNGIIRFLASSSGRVTRVLAGLALIAVGLLAVGGTAGVVVAIVGVVPLAAGLLDVCLFAPLAGLPFSGSAIRGSAHR